MYTTGFGLNPIFSPPSQIQTELSKLLKYANVSHVQLSVPNSTSCKPCILSPVPSSPKDEPPNLDSAVEIAASAKHSNVSPPVVNAPLIPITWSAGSIDPTLNVAESPVGRTSAFAVTVGVPKELVISKPDNDTSWFGAIAVPWDTVADTPDNATITPDSITGVPKETVAEIPEINTVSFGNTTVPKEVVASKPVGATSAFPNVVIFLMLK